ncbi:MAG TPA: glycosyltransferase 87 family protein [Gaiellaceae bacterium]|nr:glycosyltransferase 87 family protein [Gaiellaceae bacterium]
MSIRRLPPSWIAYGALAGAAALALVFQWRLVVSNSPTWAIYDVPVCAAGFAIAWRFQKALSLRGLLALTLLFRLGSILVFRHLGYTGDQDPNTVYLSQGHQLLHGHYPQSEYPVLAVLLFALEAAVDPNPPQVANAFLLLPCVLVCVWGIWSLRTQWSGWLAACVGLAPLDAYYWQFRYDGIPAALLVVGIVLAGRSRFALAGAALGVGACFKWTPGLAAVVLVVWLLSARHTRDAARLAVAFTATCALIYVPFLIRWPAHSVLASFRLQSVRSVTAESLWYWPARALGLTHGSVPEWAPAGVPHWVDVTVTVVQILILLAVLAALWRRPSRRTGLAVAALVPALFLTTNRVFSSQFVLILGVGWAMAAAMCARDRREQLVVGAGMLLVSTTTAFVYPFSDPFRSFSWRPWAAAALLVMLVADVLVVRFAFRASTT